MAAVNRLKPFVTRLPIRAGFLYGGRMISYQWIKLYIETLHDHKMASLSDRLWRRAVECFMFAGEVGNGGELPPIDAMAWVLHSDIEQLETEFFHLCEVGILSQIDGVYHVTNFSKRQSKISGADRIKNYRDRKKKQEYYDTETEMKQDGNECVTECYTDKNRIDKNREDKTHASILQIQEMAGTLNPDYYKEFQELFTIYDDADVLDCARWAFLDKKMPITKGTQSMWTALKRGWGKVNNKKKPASLSGYTEVKLGEL